IVITPQSRRRASVGMVRASRPSWSASRSAASTTCSRVREPRGRRRRGGLTAEPIQRNVRDTVKVTQRWHLMTVVLGEQALAEEKRLQLDLGKQATLAVVCLCAGVAPLAARW